MYALLSLHKSFVNVFGRKTTSINTFYRKIPKQTSAPVELDYKNLMRIRKQNKTKQNGMKRFSEYVYARMSLNKDEIFEFTFNDEKGACYGGIPKYQQLPFITYT